MGPAGRTIEEAEEEEDEEEEEAGDGKSKDDVHDVVAELLLLLESTWCDMRGSLCAVD